MAKHIFYNASVVVNGVDLTDHVESVSLEVSLTAVRVDPLSAAQEYFRPGQEQISDPSITFYQDYAAAKVYQTFVALWSNKTIFNVVLKPDAGAAATTNPAWTVPVFVSKMPIMTGKRGDRHMAPVTCKVGGLATIATS